MIDFGQKLQCKRMATYNYVGEGQLSRTVDPRHALTLRRQEENQLLKKIFFFHLVKFESCEIHDDDQIFFC